MNQSVVEQPGKVAAITSLMKQLLQEVRVEPVGVTARTRIVEIHARSVSAIERRLARNVIDELEGISLPFCGQERSIPVVGETQGRRASRVDRLLDDIEAAQFDQQRQRQIRADTGRPVDVVTHQHPGQEDMGETSAGATL